MKIPRVLLLLAALLTYGLVSGQSITMRMANRQFSTMRYATAIPLYEKELKRNDDNREARLKLAESYRKIKDSRNAERLYAELAHEDNPAPEHIWYYAAMLAQNGKHDEALTWYTRYITMVPGDTRGKQFADAYKNLPAFYRDSSIYRVRYVPSLNTWQAEFSPVFYKRGLLFCSNRHEESVIRKVYGYDQSSFLNLYVAHDTTSLHTEMLNEAQPVVYTASARKDHNVDYGAMTSNDSRKPGQYGRTFLFDTVQYNFKPLTLVRRFRDADGSEEHEGPATLFKGHDTLVFSVSEIRPGSKVERLSLYMASVQDGKWANARRLPFNKDNFSCAHPSLTPDNKRMYFTSDMPGGKGGTDIYYVEYDNGVWSNPVNVMDINTTGDEMFPYVDPKGKLYFSSNGHPGLGGLDIFEAEMKDGFTNIRNVGFPVNSFKDDFGLVLRPDGEKGYFSSNRKRGFGDDDIYQFEKLCAPIDVYVYDSVTLKPIADAKIRVSDQQGVTDAQGKANFCLRPNDMSFMVMKPKYVVYKAKGEGNTVRIPLSPFRFDVQGTVRSGDDKSTMEGVRVRLTDLTDNSVKEATTDKQGNYSFPLVGDHAYRVMAMKANCGTNSADLSTLNLNKSTTLRNDIHMLCTGDIIKVDNIYYDLNKAIIRPDAAAELDKLADLLWQYPDMRIELRSHTDSRSSTSSNRKLSSARAEAVVDYLASKGVVPSRMRAAGYGESLPVNKCVDGVACSEEEYQQNRRTEFKVLSIK
jgi:outer membrane protein OmpA-like peptidoglycan-associated protein